MEVVVAEPIQITVDVFFPEGPKQPIPIFEVGIRNGEGVHSVTVGSWSELRLVLTVFGKVLSVFGHPEVTVPDFDEEWVMNKLRREGSFQLFPGRIDTMI